MKKIAIFSPVLAEYREMVSISNDLAFLNKNFHVDYFDSLENVLISSEENNFFSHWKFKIKSMLFKYDLFFGFSLGGVILQQCMELLLEINKKMVFFSVPSFCNKALYQKLNEVITLINEQSVESGIHQLNEFVLYPKVMHYPIQLHDRNNAKLRLSMGLKWVRDTDSRPLLKKTKVNYLHFIGEESALVDIKNVIKPDCCQLEIVPRSGMRVLQNNPQYCIDKIKNFLLENE